MKRIFGSLLVLLLIAGCKKSEEPAAQPAEAANAEQQPPELSTTVAAAAPEPSIDIETLAVQEDFEQEAESEISMQNMTAKLDELERQIGPE